MGNVSDTRDGWSRYSWHVWWEPPSRWRGDMIHPSGEADLSLVREDASLVYLPALKTLYTSEQRYADEQRLREHSWKMIPRPAGVVELPTIANRHEVFPLLRSPLSASEWEFATLAEEEFFVGRVTQRVRATRREGVVLPYGVRPSGYWSGVNEYEYLTDDALQILLRLTAMEDGASVADISIEEMHIDTAFPTDVFTFVPPPGARIMFVPQLG
jgi:hypothetical protein